MGGDGPHNGPRNSSLGLARLGHDRFLGVGGSGTFTTTVPVLCTGGTLQLTADVLAARGSVRVGVAGDAALSVEKVVPVTSISTRHSLAWRGGSLLALRGKNISLVFKLAHAQVYTVSFKQTTHRPLSGARCPRTAGRGLGKRSSVARPRATARRSTT